MKVLFKEFITVWTRGLVRWLSRKFDSISIDLTPVEEGIADVKSDVADAKTAVEKKIEETISVDIVCDGYHTEPDPDWTYHEIVPIEEVARPKTHLKIVNKTAAPNISSGYNVLVDGKLFYDSPQSYADKYDAGAVLVDEDIYGKEIAFVHYTAAQQHSSHTLTADVTYSIEGGIYGATKAISAKLDGISEQLDDMPKEADLKKRYSARFEQNEDGRDTYTMVMPMVAGVEEETESTVVVTI